MNDTVARMTEQIDAWADAWSADIWRACWQGALAVALVWLVCLAWRRLSPRWQCWLWRLAVLKFALALFWAVPLDVPLLAPPPPVEVDITTEPIALAPMTLPNFDESQVPLLEPTDVAVAAPPAPVWRPRLVVIAMAVWFIGVAICAIRLLRQWWSARRLRVGAGLVEDAALLDILDEERARAGLRRAPRLLESETLIGPALVGIVRPAIMVPAAMLAALAPDSLRLLLRHELAHQRRRDLAWNLLLAVVGAVFFFHPLVWLALRRHRQSQESACDAWVLESGDTEPASYGQLLVDVAAGFARARPNPAVTGVVGSARTLKRRLAAMPSFRPPRLRTTIAITLLLCLTAPVGLIPWHLVAREPVDVVGEILANWEGRRQDVTSFEYEVEADATVDFMGPQQGHTQVTYIRSGNKLAETETSETRFVGTDRVDHNKSTRTFDGRVNKWTFQGQQDGQHVESHGMRKGPTPHDNLGTGAELFAINLEHNPSELFKRQGIEIAKARLVREHAQFDGHDCVEIAIPQATSGSVRVFVDRARDDIPIGWVVELDADSTVRYEMDYEKDDKLGWTAAGLSGGLYDKSGNAVTQLNAKVIRRVFNQPVDDDVFDLKYPVGATVVESVPDTDDHVINYYIAGEDGTLQFSHSDKVGKLRRRPENILDGTSPGDASDENDDRQAEPAENDQSSAEANAETSTDTRASGPYTYPITITGKAVNQQNEPIVSARVFLASPRTDGEPLATTVTAEDGGYRFDEIPLPIKPADTNFSEDVGAFEVFGLADGFGMTWRPLKWFYPDAESRKQFELADQPERDSPTSYGRNDKIELDLHFGPPATIGGRVVDDRGEPLAGTQLAIRDGKPITDELSEWDLESFNWRALVPESVKVCQTDEDGRFAFTGLPVGHGFWVDVRPPGHTGRSVSMNTPNRPMDDDQATAGATSGMEIVFPRPRLVKVQVVCGDTGEPAAKVGVGGKVLKAGFWETTDEDGFVEVPLPDGRFAATVFPRYRTPYLRTELELDVSEKSAQETTVVRLRPAAIVDIAVTDADTGKPLEGVDVWTGSIDSRQPQGRPQVYGYRSWEVETRLSHYDAPRTDASGKMRVYFEPGTHRIGVGLEAYPKGYRPVDRNGQEVDCQLDVPMSIEFTMRKRMPRKEKKAPEPVDVDRSSSDTNDTSDASSRIVGEILTAWQARPAVQTIDCEISVNNFTNGTSSDADEAATPARGLNRRSVTLVRSGPKFIKTIKGEEWLSGSPDRVGFESIDAFDGGQTRLLGGGTHTENGVTHPIKPSGMIKRSDTPANNLFDDVNIKPLALALSPRQAIAQYGYDLAETKLLGEHVDRGGRDCLELVVASKLGSVDRRIHVYADRERDYLPIGLVVEFDGKVYVDYVIDYQQNESDKWKVSGWSWTQRSFPPSKWTAKVERLEINRPVDDGMFELTYPAGTRVGEQISGKLNMYVAEADGTLRLIDTRENAPAKPEPADKGGDDEAPDWTVSFTPGVSGAKDIESKVVPPSSQK